MEELKKDGVIKERYWLVEAIGSGSFGEVWHAMDMLLDCDVAIKFYIALDNRGVAEFMNEYKNTMSLAHPKLLTTQYFDIWNNRPFLIMKYCRQGSADKLVGNTDESTIWKFIADVASGLEYLHGLPEPIIHQDIKPGNILLSDNDFLITDFGISKKVRSTLRKQSRRATGAGSIAYMAPEYATSKPLPVKASDIWALGVSIYELATGELPFCGMGGALQNAGAAIPELDSCWSADLNSLMGRCLAKETWDRPTATEIAEIASRKSGQERISSEQRDKVTRAARTVPGQRATRRLNTEPESTEMYNFVDLGLSVKWADRSYGAENPKQLGKAMSIASFKNIGATGNGVTLPTIKEFEELKRRCRWTARKMRHETIGYDVTGPNGRSIYIPIVPVQSAQERVPVAQWRKMEKQILLATLEEYDDPEDPIRFMVSQYDCRITTISVPDAIYFRLVK